MYLSDMLMNHAHQHGLTTMAELFQGPHAAPHQLINLIVGLGGALGGAFEIGSDAGGGGASSLGSGEDEEAQQEHTHAVDPVLSLMATDGVSSESGTVESGADGSGAGQ